MADQEAIAAGLFCDEPGAFRSYVFRIATLTALSTIIASLGLIANSAAVVIGAMLVAPLMQPILGFASSLTLGQPKREVASLTLIVFSTIEAAAIAMLVGVIVPAFTVITLTPELSSRTAPALVDLGIALAAGAAGAYVTVRPSVGAAIAGPAIAVALAPPLATFGILLVRGNNRLATGALLLFLTNLIGIVVAAVVVFVVTGLRAHDTVNRQHRLVIAATFLIMIVIAVPLANTSIRTIQLSSDEAKIRSILIPQLRASGFGIQNLAVIRDHGTIVVSADIAGQSSLPDSAQLARILTAMLDTPVRIIIRSTLRQETTSQSAPPTR